MIYGATKMIQVSPLKHTLNTPSRKFSSSGTESIPAFDYCKGVWTNGDWKAGYTCHCV